MAPQMHTMDTESIVVLISGSWSADRLAKGARPGVEAPWKLRPFLGTNQHGVFAPRTPRRDVFLRNGGWLGVTGDV